jgi:two-component system invasion response regulator UvrY
MKRPPLPGHKIKVMLVDDHAILREALAGILEPQPEFSVVGSFSSVREATAPEITPPDVIVLDVTMPEMGGLGGMPQLLKRFPRARVLMLSMHPAEVFGLRALKAGAKGYLTKETRPSELVEAIRRVGTGGRVIPEEMVEVLASGVDPSVVAPPHEQLTDREFEILQRLAAGAKTAEIAKDLGLSARTVSNDRQRIFQQLGFQSNADVARYAMENHLPTS